jgi:NAD(P)-dependent dehydrogenase (short-subunit alcohol dehydrogenase family)
MDIVITGCSRGIGFELVKLFAAEPENRVLAVTRNIKPLETVAANGNVIPSSLDMADSSFVDEVVKTVNLLDFRPLILINNAGFLVNKPFHSLSSADFDAMFAIQVKAPFLLTQALIPFFTRDAHIVNIGSMGGYQGSAKFSGLSLYSASKGALAILSECLAEELKDSHIHVNCLALGAAQTEMLAQAFPGFQAPVSALEMAAFIHHFATETGRFINGKILPISSSTP